MTRINRAAWVALSHDEARAQQLTLELTLLCPDAVRRGVIGLMCAEAGRTTLWSAEEMRDRAKRALMKGWEGSSYEDLRKFELRQEFPALFT